MAQSITINLSDRLYKQLHRAAELAHQLAKRRLVEPRLRPCRLTMNSGYVLVPSGLKQTGILRSFMINIAAAIIFVPS